MSSEILQAVFKKYQTFILPILAVLVALVLFVVVVIPQGLKIPDTNKQIQKSQSDLQTLTTKESVLESIDTQKFQDDINTSFQALPQDPDIAGVFNQILLVLNTNGLSLDDITISQVPADNSNTLTDYLLKVNSTGSTESLNKFIEQTKQIPRVVKVQALDAGLGEAAPTAGFSSPNNSGGQSLQIEITVQTFYQGVPSTQSLQTDAPLTLPTPDNQKLITQIRDELNALPALASQSAISLPSGKEDPFQ